MAGDPVPATIEDLEVLTLGVYGEDDVVVLVSPDRPVPDGARLG